MAEEILHIKTLSISLIFLFALHFTTEAQTNFQKGLVVVHSQDTVRGLIDLQDWEKNPKSITFKENMNSIEQNFTPSQIRYFEVLNSNEHFVRAVISISLDNSMIEATDGYLTATYKTDTVFLRVLTSGKCISLFAYKDRIKARYYISSNASPENIQELVYTLQKIKIAGSDELGVGYLERYKDQLVSVALKCGTLTENLKVQIKKARYTSDLGSLAMEINGQSRHKALSNASNSISEDHLRYLASVGLASTTLFPIGNTSNDNTTLSPFFSLAIDKARIQGISKFHFVYELSIISETHVNGLGYNLSLLTPSLTMLGKYYLNRGYAKTFVGGGLRFNVSRINQIDFHQTQWAVWPSVPLKAGVQLNGRVELSYCFTPIVGQVTIDKVSSFDIKTNQFGLSYILGPRSKSKG